MTTPPLAEQVKQRILMMQQAQSHYKRETPNWMCHSFIIIELEQVLSMIDKTAKELGRMKQETHDEMMGSNIPQLILAKNAFNAAIALLIKKEE